jgi:DNA-binding SARP family transcriptional activator
MRAGPWDLVRDPLRSTNPPRQVRASDRIFALQRVSDALLTVLTHLQSVEGEGLIVLRALGNAEIETAVTTLTPSQEIVFAAALYLVLERGKRVSRARLASLLWPRVPEKARAHRLRQTILQLKKLGVTLKADRDSLQLSQHDARSDIDAPLLASANLSTGFASVEFLAGYAPRCSDAFRDWVDLKKQEIHGTIASTLVRELEGARLRGDWLGVERTASQCLALDPFNEIAVLALAEAVAMGGGKRRAVAILDRYIAEVGESGSDLRLPATLLRRRVAERVSERIDLQDVDPPFVGREAEMQSLIAGFQAARAGRGGALLVVGEPGIGKSRLSDELVRFAELQGAQVQRTACRRTDVNRPLSLFVDIVPQLREMPGALGCAPETFASLKRLTDFELRSRDTSRTFDSEMLFVDLRNALFDLIDSLAEERCLVLVIEDIHWLDDVSSKILGWMVEWAATKRAFLLLNSRPSNSSVARYLDGGSLTTLSLDPLSATASSAVLHSIAARPDYGPMPEFFAWCVRVAEGNPFFLQELAHHWAETGHTYEAPPSVTKVLEQRLSRLSPEALQVLQICAVLGEHATLERAEQVLEYPAHRLLSAVEELSKAAMLGPTREGADQSAGCLHPRHDLLAAAALGGLAQISLRLMHRRAAEVLEKEIATEIMPTTLLWACASHRHIAGDRQRALTLSVACAEHLLDVGLAGDASIAFQKSLDYCATDEQRLEVLPRMAFSSQLNGEWAKTKEALRTCIRLTQKVNPTTSSHNEFELLLIAARLLSDLDYPLLLADIIPCVESNDASPAHRVRAAVMALKIATDIGPSKALDSIYRHVEPLLENPEVPETSRLEVEIIYRTTQKREAVPIDALQQFAESARVTGGEIAYSNALLTAASACRISARYEQGLAFLAQAFEHAASHKRRATLSRVFITELRLHMAAGAIGRAESTLARMMAHPIDPDDSFALAEAQVHKTRIAIEKGDVKGAAAAFSAVPEVPLTYSARRRAYTLAIQLRIRLMENASQDEIRKLVSDLRLEHLKVRSLAVDDFETLALYAGLCALGETTQGVDLLREYVQVYRPSAWPVPEQIQEVLRLAAKNLPECKQTTQQDLNVGYPTTAGVPRTNTSDSSLKY